MIAPTNPMEIRYEELMQPDKVLVCRDVECDVYVCECMLYMCGMDLFSELIFDRHNNGNGRKW